MKEPLQDWMIYKKAMISQTIYARLTLRSVGKIAPLEWGKRKPCEQEKVK